MALPSYIPVPNSAVPIHPPTINSPTPHVPTKKPPAPTFPPKTQPTQPQTRKFAVPSTASISTNVSDLLLSSLLPPNLPKLPQSTATKAGGGVRELSTQKEALSLPLMSNNFRRFVTKVGPFFWMQDRVEELLFWRKPTWTYAYILVWTSISFKPKLVLLLPSAGLLMLLLHIHEKHQPLPSLLGVPLPPASDPTNRLVPSQETIASAAVASSSAFSISTVSDGDAATAIPVVPPKEAESGVDYYMNLQAIQNLLGLVSDAYDYITPKLVTLTSPTISTSPTSFPLTQTHLILLLLPATLLLPLIPNFLLPYLLLSIGLLPPFIFHPSINPYILNLPRNRQLLSLRSTLEPYLLDDTLSDEMGRKRIWKVEVWENERLDISKGGGWGSKALRGGERAPWVKVRSGVREVLWDDVKDGEDRDKLGLGLKVGWDWVEGMEWRVDVSGLWSDVGVDEDGWAYADDSWQNPSSTPSTEADLPGLVEKNMPSMALKRVTRRRRWWRRVYLSDPGE